MWHGGACCGLTSVKFLGEQLSCAGLLTKAVFQDTTGLNTKCSTNNRREAVPMARQQLDWLEAPGRFELRDPALVLSKLLPQLRQVCAPKNAQNRLL